MSEKRPPIYLITGIVIGILFGLLVSYVIFPIRYVDTSPSSLSENQKGVYRGLVARAFLFEADTGRAFSRLALLNDADVGTALITQAQQLAAESSDPTAARGLALLASYTTNPNLVITPLVQRTAVPTQIAALSSVTAAATMEISKTPTLFMTLTPRPSSTPKPTQGPPYKLANQKEVCDPDSTTPLLMVYVFDKNGNGIPGVRVEISISDGGQNDFYTGFYPEISSGYADYEMSNGFIYNLRVGEGGDTVSGLSVPKCEGPNGTTYSGSLELKFKQP